MKIPLDAGNVLITGSRGYLGWGRGTSSVLRLSIAYG